ncbi:MAG: hypothetical protein WB688_21690 [Trebonia sp.]
MQDLTCRGGGADDRGGGAGGRGQADYGIGHGHATALVGYALAQRAAGGTEGPP